MIKLTELMVGNWVYNTHHKKAIQLTPYDFFTHSHDADGSQRLLGEPKPVSGRDFDPIPLTPEILAKNGFKKGDFCWSWCKGNEEVCVIFARCRVVEISYTKLVFNPEDAEEIDYGSQMEFGYGCDCAVHQFQQFLTLCGIEKEITLDGVIVDIPLDPLP